MITTLIWVGSTVLVFGCGQYYGKYTHQQKTNEQDQRIKWIDCGHKIGRINEREKIHKELSKMLNDQNLGVIGEFDLQNYFQHQ